MGMAYGRGWLDRLMAYALLDSFYSVWDTS